jgi:hypothetical protein
MMVFIAYAVLVFWAVGKHRRKWKGLLYIALGVAGIVAISMLHWQLSIWTNGFVALPLLQAMMYPFAALVLVTSGYIFVLPRRDLPHLCRRCGYDLTGQEESPATCPECGLVHGGIMHPSTLCGGCGRDRPRCICPSQPVVRTDTGPELAAKRRRAAQSLIARGGGVTRG